MMREALSPWLQHKEFLIIKCLQMVVKQLNNVKHLATSLLAKIAQKKVVESQP